MLLDQIQKYTDNFIDIYLLAEYAYCQRASFYMITGYEDGQEENCYIQRGREYHFKIDIAGKRYRDYYQEFKSLNIKSYKHLIKGKTDLVRIYKNFAIPVEYKSGNYQEADSHRFQLFLQGLCIEEQLNTNVNEGIVYFYRINKSLKYRFSCEYRSEALNMIEEFKNKLSSNNILNFKQLNKQNCINCSFYDICIPNVKKL